MSQQSVVVQLPDALYERIREIAEQSNRPLETVLVDSLALLFGELPAETDFSAEMLQNLNDEQLWALVYRPLAWPQESRLRELIALGKRTALTDAEQAEIESLIRLVDRYTLLRSHALLLLKQRGHDVERRLKLGA
jgi:hypothetical protein